MHTDQENLDTNNDFYLEATKREVKKLEVGHFTGNVEFQFNFKDGSVANQNITLRKSLKRA